MAGSKERSHCLERCKEKRLHHHANVEFGLPHEEEIEKLEIRLAAEYTPEGINTGELEILEQHLVV